MRTGIADDPPSAADWRAVDGLVETCRAADGLEIPLHRTPGGDAREKNQLLFWEAGALLGIATLLPGHEVEVLGAVHPDHRRQGIGRRLLAAVETECRSRGLSEYLLVCESNSAGCAFAERAGGVFEFAEHLMAFDWMTAGQGLPAADVVEIALAGEDDIDDLVRVRRDEGTDDVQSRRIVEGWMNSRASQLLIARTDGRPVGMIRITPTRDVVWLNSFTIDPDLRGMGLGRRMLASILGSRDPGERILLEVETDNEAALGLYRSSGFSVLTTYRYYRHRLARPTGRGSGRSPP